MKNKKKNKATRQAGHRLCKKISKSPVTYFYKPSFHKEAFITGEHATICVIGSHNLYALEQTTDITCLQKLQEEMMEKEAMTITRVPEQEKKTRISGWWFVAPSIVTSLAIVALTIKKALKR